MRVVVNDVWQHLSSRWDQSPRHVAVAYYSCDDGLAFAADDVLVVDASDKAIASGQTDASALRRAVKAGARVYSMPALHAKIYALGEHVLIGSANSSRSSRDTLIECLAESRNPHAVAQSIAFVTALSEHAAVVDEAFLARIEKIKVTRAPNGRGRRPDVSVRRPRCWLVGVHEVPYPGDEAAVEARKNELAQEAHSANEELGWFWWPGDTSVFHRDVQAGDLIVQIWSPRAGPCDEQDIQVYRHARLCEIETQRGVRARAYHAAWPADYESTWISLTDFRSLIARTGWNVRVTKGSCREIPGEISSLLADLWPKTT